MNKGRPPRRGVQMTPAHESAFGIQEPIQHFWSAEQHFKIAKLPSCGLWPNGLWVTFMHTLFNLSQKDAARFKP